MRADYNLHGITTVHAATIKHHVPVVSPLLSGLGITVASFRTAWLEDARSLQAQRTRLTAGQCDDV